MRDKRKSNKIQHQNLNTGRVERRRKSRQRLGEEERGREERGERERRREGEEERGEREQNRKTIQHEDILIQISPSLPDGYM